MGRVIFHIDLNAFFANAEILKDPSLAGKPIAVAGTSRRSVVSTCSYEARQYGVRSAMSIQEALKKCPDLILVSSNHEYYEELSAKFINYVKRYSRFVEQVSIDECYVDVTDKIKTYKYPLDLAWELQKNLLKEFGLKCSIGVAPNKFLAKMASDMRKPMGITVLRISEVEQKLWPLDIKEMRGIGNKTLPHVKALGINTIGDLAKYEDINQLKMIFGKNTQLILDKTHGYDCEPLVVNTEIKSIGQSTTLLEDISDYQEIKGVFNSLSRLVAKRLHDEHFAGDVISISIRYFDFKTIVRSRKLDQFIYRQSDIFENAIVLFDELNNDEEIRLLGITIGNVKDLSSINFQINMFDDYQDSINDVIMSLNKQLLLGGKLKKASEVLGEKNDIG